MVFAGGLFRFMEGYFFIVWDGGRFRVSVRVMRNMFRLDCGLTGLQFLGFKTWNCFVVTGNGAFFVIILFKDWDGVVSFLRSCICDRIDITIRLPTIFKGCFHLLDFILQLRNWVLFDFFLYLFLLWITYLICWSP